MAHKNLAALYRSEFHDEVSAARHEREVQRIARGLPSGFADPLPTDPFGPLFDSSNAAAGPGSHLPTLPRVPRPPDLRQLGAPRAPARPYPGPRPKR
jgi:hypothetical protein